MVEYTFKIDFTDKGKKYTGTSVLNIINCLDLQI